MTGVDVPPQAGPGGPSGSIAAEARAVPARGDDLPTRLHPARLGLALRLSLLGLATLSFNATRVAGFSVSDLLFMTSAVAIMVKLLIGDERFLTRRSGRRGSQLVLAGTILMLTGATLSAFGSWTPLASTMVVVRLGWSTMVWFWILRSVCRDRQAMFSMIKAVRFTVLASAVLAVAGDNGLQVNPTDFGDGRQAALTFHPGELMNFLVAGFFLVAVPVFVPTSGPHRRFATAGWVAAVVVMVLGIFATGSTSALVALGAALVTLISVVIYTGSSRMRRRRRTPLPTMLLVGAAIAGLFVLFSSDYPVTERLMGLSDGSSNLDDSMEERSQANREIIGNFDSYLLVGIGPHFASGVAESIATSEFTSDGKQHNHVHNMHLKMLYEAGLIALLGLWLIIFAVARQAYRLVVSTRGTDLYPVALGILGGFVAANVSSMFGPTAYARHFWLSFALIGCLWSLRRLELARRPTAVLVDGM